MGDANIGDERISSQRESTKFGEREEDMVEDSILVQSFEGQ